MKAIMKYHYNMLKMHNLKQKNER